MRPWRRKQLKKDGSKAPFLNYTIFGNVLPKHWEIES
jgi:hypothetical protein